MDESKSLEIAKAFGYLTEKEVLLLRQTAASLCEYKDDICPTIVNIGAGSGTSALALREGCPCSMLYSIDWSPGGPLGGLENEINAFRGTPFDIPLQVLGDSSEAGRKWERGQTISLLFIDGDHSFAGVTNDIIAWFPHVMVGKYIAFHDYGDRNWPDVKVVADELLKNQLSLSKVDKLAVFTKIRDEL